MSIELTRDSETISLTGTGWAFYLNLAEEYGWKPIGTSHPDEENWGGGYDSSDGQTVAAGDALALSEAFASALSDPGREEREVEIAEFLSAALEQAVGFPCPVEPPEDEGATLRELQSFCGRGEFTIE